MSIATSHGDFYDHEFGVHGDGTTDDGPAIQAAIAACVAGGGSRVILTKPTIGIGTTVLIPSSVELVISASVVCTALSGISGAIFANQSVSNGNNQIAISGAGVIDAKSLVNFGIHLTKVTVSEITDVQVKNASRHGILVDGASADVLIVSVDARNNSTSSAGTYFGIAFAGSASHCTTVGCRGTDDAGAGGTQGSGWGEVSGMTGDYNVYAGCAFEGNVSASPPPTVGAHSGATTTGSFTNAALITPTITNPTVTTGSFTNPAIAGSALSGAGVLGLSGGHLTLGDGSDASTIIDDDTAASGALAGFYPAPTLAAGVATGAALGTDVVVLTGTQTISGVKTFSADPVLAQGADHTLQVQQITANNTNGNNFTLAAAQGRGSGNGGVLNLNPGAGGGGGGSPGIVAINRSGLQPPILGMTYTAMPNGSQTLTAARLLGGFIQHNATGSSNDTFDTGANLDAAIPGVQVGDSFSCWLANIGGATITLVGASGITTTALTHGTVAGSSSVYLTFVRTGTAAWMVVN